MAPTVLRRTPHDARLLDRTGIISASRPRPPGRADGTPQSGELAGRRRFPRSSVASVAAAVLMFAVAGGAVLDLPVASDPPTSLADGGGHPSQPSPDVGQVVPRAPVPEPKPRDTKPRPKPKTKAETPAPVLAAQPPAGERDVDAAAEEPVEVPQPADVVPRAPQVSDTADRVSDGLEEFRRLAAAMSRYGGTESYDGYRGSEPELWQGGASYGGSGEFDEEDGGRDVERYDRDDGDRDCPRSGSSTQYSAMW